MRNLLLALTLCVALVAGCSKPADDAVTLQLNWKAEPEFGGFYAADFAKHGVNVTIAPGGESTATIELLGAGHTPFAIVSADEIPVGREKGAHVVALFAVYQTFPQGILTRADRGLKTIDDVFTHPGTLGIEAGLPYAAFLKEKYAFDKLKVTPTCDLGLVQSDPTYAMQCYVTSEPIAAKKSGLNVSTFMVADAGYNPYATVLATTDEYLKAHPDVVKKVVAAVAEGWQTYLNDPTPTNVAMNKLNPTMDLATFQASADAQKPLILTGDSEHSGLGTMTTERWTELLAQLKRLKVTTTDVQPSDCFQNVTP